MNTVLAIDDDKTTLEIIESQLNLCGYRVITEIRPVKGVELAKEFLPDIILLDLNMPEMSGFDVIHALKNDKLTQDIPVIILTISKDKQTVINAMRYGVFDYIVKPYDPEKLGMKIKSAIRFGDNKRAMNLSEYIDISHKGENALIIMRGEMRGQEFQNDLTRLFNSFFIKQVQGKTCIFDIKEMKDFNDDDVKQFMKVLSMFHGSNIKVVTGKHYGQIVSSYDIDDRVELFLSVGDLDLAMNESDTLF